MSLQLASDGSSSQPTQRGRARRALWIAGIAAATLLGGCRAPGPYVHLATTQAVEQRPFLAGVATEVFTPEPGTYPLGGYGGGGRRAEWPFWMGLGWPGRISLAAHQWWHASGDERRSDMLKPNEGAHDDLSARALVLRPEGGVPAAIVRLDAIGTTTELHAAVAARVADLGYRPETVLLASTHTHSGAAGYMRTPFAAVAAMDNFRAELEARIALACAVAIRRAHETARPAAIGFGRARDAAPDGTILIAENRRSSYMDVAVDDVDREIGLVRVADRESGAPIAWVVSYAVHPTVLGTKNLKYSADIVGGIERAVTARLGAPAIFLQAAEGDVGPRRISSHDGLTRIEEAGQAMADLVAAPCRAIETTDQLAISASLGEKEMGSPHVLVAAGRGQMIDHWDGPAGWLALPVTVPLSLPFWLFGATNIHVVGTWTGGFGVRGDLDRLIDRTTTRLGGLRLRVGDEDVAFLGMPGEATHDVGEALKAEAIRRGASRAFFVGLAYDHIGYIASETEYRRGGYEAISTLFGVGTAAGLVAAQGEVLTALGYERSE